MPVRRKTVSQTRAIEPARRLADLLIQIGHLSYLLKYQSLFVSFLFHSEYIKVIDGYGITVLHVTRHGYSFTQKILREVSFGNVGSITVQINLRSSFSIFKLQFGILKQGPGWPFIY